MPPPSTNGSEQSYQWLPGLSLKDIDPPELPKAYIDFVQQKISLGEKVNKLQEGWERECFGAREGERNNSLTRLAGRYVTKGLSKEEILPLLESINQQFSPPLPNREVETILDSIWKRDHRQKEPLPNQEALSYEDLNLQSSLEISRLETRVEWIVKNLIPKDGNTLLHSIGGVGKSYLLYQLGKRVSAGEEFFGLSTMKMPVYYVDFENPLPEIVDRMKKIGGTDNLKIWHLSHEPGPVRFDADEWEVYKTFPPGLFIIDSLRSSYLDEENSSKVAAFIMARFKEVRSMGNTVILIHHENKIGSYRGSTAWFDLSDHILKFSRVKEIGSDKDVDDDNFNLPIRLGLGGKSRFSSALELKPMFFKFENQLLVRAEDPENEPLENLRKILVGMGDSGGIPPTQGDFIKLIRKEFQVGKDKARSMIKKGEGVYWDSIVNRSLDNRVTYSPIFKEGEV